MTTTYRIDGIDLNRWLVSRGSTYRSPVSTERFSASVPGRHGVVDAGLPTFTAPLVTLVLSPHVGWAEATDLEGLVDDLVALTAKPSVLLAREVGGVRREAAARLVSLDFDPERFLFDRFATATGVFELPGVFWRDQSFSTVDVPAGTHWVPQLGGSAPITDAVIRWGPGPITGQPHSLTDVSTGTGVSLDWSPPAEFYAYLDVGSLGAWSTRGDSAWSPDLHTRRDSHIDFPAAGPLQLWPTLGSGVRAVRVESSHPVTIRFRRAWL